MLEEAFQDTKRLFREGMAKYIYDFTLTGNAYFNGKVLQVSSTNLNNSIERYPAKFLPDHAVSPLLS
jgi:hypothetical protein